MELFLFLVIVGLVVLVGVAYAVQQQQNGAESFGSLGAIACAICGSQGVSEHGAGGYRCDTCGYDTDVAQPPEQARRVHQIQELSIAESCLSLALHELDESRERVHMVPVEFNSHNHGRKRKETLGPFHDRYLEGFEQSSEAIGILRRLVGELPGLGAALTALGSVAPPPRDNTGFNEAVNASSAAVERARAILDTERRALVQAFRR